MIPAGDGRIDGATAPGPVQQWSKLPYGLLGKIYPRLDARVDRVRFTAVCTQWRAAASHPHRRVLPWLFLNPCCGEGETRHLYFPQDRTVQPHLPFLHKAAGRCFVGSHEGGWIASSETPFRIINVFTGTEVALPGWHIVNRLERIGDPLVLQKIIFSEDHLLRRSSPRDLPGFGGQHDDGLADIAFCKGELYGITRYTKRLIKYELGVDQHAAPVLVNVHWLCTLGNYWEVPHEHARYIVELRGKLLMVGSNNKWWSRCLRNVCGTRFTVHELVDTDTTMDIRNGMKYKWVEVNSLGEHALFLGPTCSKAVRVPASGCGDVQRIRVFSNPVLTADADAETTRRLWLFMQRELGPLGTLLDAVVDMPEESADDVRTKVEAFHAVQGLMIQHFRPLLGPHGSGARTQLLSGLLMQMAGVANQTSEDSLEDTM